MSLGSGSEPDFVFVSGVRGGGTKKSTFKARSLRDPPSASEPLLASGSSSIFLASTFESVLASGSVSERPGTP